MKTTSIFVRQNDKIITLLKEIKEVLVDAKKEERDNRGNG